MFCLVIKGFFVYLQAVKGVSIISHPEQIDPKKLYILRNALKLSWLICALRKIGCSVPIGDMVFVSELLGDY